MDVLVAGERAELLDAGLDVVAGDPLAGGDRVEVDLVDDGGVVVDDAVRNVDAQVALRLAAPRATAAARGRPCARATRAGPSARRRSGRPGRRGSRACSRTGLSQPQGARDHAPAGWTSPRAAASAMSVRWWEPAQRDLGHRARTPLARAAARSRPVPTTESTRPPALTSCRRPPARCRRAARTRPAGVGCVQPSIGSPVRGVVGVALGGDHHGDGGVRRPAQVGQLGEVPGGGRRAARRRAGSAAGRARPASPGRRSGR